MPPKKVDSGFEKATSQNLPQVDLEMFLDFLVNNENFCSAEMRGVKVMKSARANYGDSAVGNVQIQRTNNLCTVRATICPEHKIHKKAYAVSVEVDENENEIKSAVCHDCVASAEGCKHAVAILAWLYRRSEEPSPTSVECYWKKAALSQIGTTVKGIPIKSMTHCEGVVSSDTVKGTTHLHDFFNTVLQKGIANGSTGQIILDYKPPSAIYALSIHHLSLLCTNKSSVQSFLNHCESEMTESSCREAEKETRLQSTSLIWYELRYGRITASILYEVARCKTSTGSLMERIMGSRTPDTVDMQRGRELEPIVIKVIQKTLKCKINKVGLLLSKKFPVFGASPDGITSTHVVEVKCPKKESTFKNYYDGQIKNKFRAQIQLQMLFANRKKAYFCIALPNFEESGDVQIVEEDFDLDFLEPLMESAQEYWNHNIFPLIVKK